MAKKLAISPCSENWFSMKENQLGRFCHSCQKTVVDFTQSSSREIDDYLQKHQNKNVCGRFVQTQIDAYNVYISENDFVESYSSYQRFLAVFLLVFGLDVFGVNVLFSQEIADSIPVQTQAIDSIFQSDSLLTSSDSLQEKSDFLQLKVDSVLHNPWFLDPIQTKCEIMFLGNVVITSGSVIQYVDADEPSFIFPKKESSDEKEIKKETKNELPVPNLMERKSKRRKKVVPHFPNEYIKPDDIEMKQE